MFEGNTSRLHGVVENLIFHHELFGNLDNFLVSIMFFVCDIIAECTS